MPAYPAPADTRPEHPDHVPATGEALRLALQEVASPVVVVAVRTADEARGATIGSFASVSLDPPLVSFNVTHETRLYDALRESRAFTVQILAEDQPDVAAHFAIPDASGADQFAPFPHTLAPGLAPRLDGVLSTLVCAVEMTVEAGDHTVVIGTVESIVRGRRAAPLLYYRQSYRGIGDAV